MRFCYNCGKQVEDNVLICPDCGALVKRYTEDMDQNEIPRTPEQQAEQTYKGRIYEAENGKIKVRGLLKAWLIITAVVCGYIAFSFFSLLLVYRNQGFYTSVIASFTPEQLAMFGGYEAFMELWNELMDIVSQTYVYLIILEVFCVLKFACGIWMLAAPAKIPFVARQGLILLIAALLLLLQNPAFAIAFATDGFVTSLLLGQDKLLLK